MISTILSLIGLEFATISCQLTIPFITAYKFPIKLAKKGFFVGDSEKLADTIQTVKERHKLSKLSKIIFWIPGVNILFTKIYSSRKIKEIEELLRQNNLLIPMSDDEKKEFESLKGLGRYSYVSSDLPKKWNSFNHDKSKSNCIVLSDDDCKVVESEPVIFDQSAKNKPKILKREFKPYRKNK